MNEKAKQGNEEENQLLNQLDYKEKTCLITMDLKNSSPKSFGEEEKNNIDKEIPIAFINYKLKTDPNYSLNENNQNFEEKINDEENSGTDKKDSDQKSDDNFQNLNTNIDPKESFSQSDEVEDELFNSSNDSDNNDLHNSEEIDKEKIPNQETPYTDLNESDPFFNLDERLNIKDSLNFDIPTSGSNEENLIESNFGNLSDNTNNTDNSQYLTTSSINTDEYPDTTDKISQQKDFSQKKILKESSEFISEPTHKKDQDHHSIKEGSQNTTNVSSQPYLTDEEELYDNYIDTITHSTDKKFIKQKIQEKLVNFKTENRKLIQDLLENNNLPEDKKDEIIDNILLGKNEDIIIENISQQILNKKGYEIFENRDKAIKHEAKIYEQTYRQYKKSRQIFLFIFTTTICLILFFSIYFAYKTYAPIRLYENTIIAIKEDRHLDAESLFNEAYKLKPDIHYTIEIGMAYAKKGMITEGEKKFNLLLNDFPIDLDSLLANAAFFRKLKRFNKARNILNKTRRFYPDNIAQMNEEVNLLITEGKNLKNSDKSHKLWEQAEKIISDLSVIDPNNNFKYLQKLVVLSALNHEFNRAKNYFILLKEHKEPYEIESMSIYLDYLMDVQEDNQKKSFIKQEKKITDLEQAYIVSIVYSILDNLKRNYGEHYDIELLQSRWEKVIGKSELALKHAQRGLDLIEIENNYFLNDNKVKALNIIGQLYIKKNENILARNSFKKSLEVNSQDPLANYYLGKLNFLNLHQYLTSYEQLITAYNEWNDPNSIRYADILYTLGYIDLHIGKSIPNIPDPEKQKTRQKHFKRSITFWSELAKLNIKGKNYLVDFNLGTGYLYLQEYEMAEIFYESNLELLEPTVKYFNNKNDIFIRETGFKREELQILSDTYNNLAVAQIGKNSSGSPTPIDINGEAIEYFISSIILKDKIGDFKGIPYANFNTLNDYPKNNLAFIKQRPFRIADTSIPKSIIPITY